MNDALLDEVIAKAVGAAGRVVPIPRFLQWLVAAIVAAVIYGLIYAAKHIDLASLFRAWAEHAAKNPPIPGPPEADPPAPAMPMPDGGLPVPGDPTTGEKP